MSIEFVFWCLFFVILILDFVQNITICMFIQEMKDEIIEAQEQK